MLTIHSTIISFCNTLHKINISVNFGCFRSRDVRVRDARGGCHILNTEYAQWLFEHEMKSCSKVLHSFVINDSNCVLYRIASIATKQRAGPGRRCIPLCVRQTFRIMVLRYQMVSDSSCFHGA